MPPKGADFGPGIPIRLEVFPPSTVSRPSLMLPPSQDAALPAMAAKVIPDMEIKEAKAMAASLTEAGESKVLFSPRQSSVSHIPFPHRLKVNLPWWEAAGASPAVLRLIDVGVNWEKEVPCGLKVMPCQWPDQDLQACQGVLQEETYTRRRRRVATVCDRSRPFATGRDPFF